MRTSALLHTTAGQLRNMLLANVTARPNYRVVEDIENTAKELKGLCPYSADKARRISQCALVFYSEALDDGNEHSDKAAQYQRMLELAAQIDHAATVHQHKGN
uniref:hypothetical protein n=1 Tax=Marinobacterium profundum TaxID=1714300 RepID=UPI00082F8BEC|nr:hypothetical protein [Marinobacterium profundum]